MPCRPTIRMMPAYVDDSNGSSLRSMHSAHKYTAVLHTSHSLISTFITFKWTNTTNSSFIFEKRKLSLAFAPSYAIKSWTFILCKNAHTHNTSSSLAGQYELLNGVLSPWSRRLLCPDKWLKTSKKKQEMGMNGNDRRRRKNDLQNSHPKCSTEFIK